MRSTLGAGIIDVEEILQVREIIGGAHFIDRSEGNRDLIAAGEFEHLLGFEAAFDMEMQLGLGQTGDEGVEIAHRRSIAGARRGASATRSAVHALSAHAFQRDPPMGL